jgi:hypothetical protein
VFGLIPSITAAAFVRIPFTWTRFIACRGQVRKHRNRICKLVGGLRLQEILIQRR